MVFFPKHLGKLVNFLRNLWKRLQASLTKLYFPEFCRKYWYLLDHSRFITNTLNWQKQFTCFHFYKLEILWWPNCTLLLMCNRQAMLFKSSVFFKLTFLGQTLHLAELQELWHCTTEWEQYTCRWLVLYLWLLDSCNGWQTEGVHFF